MKPTGGVIKRRPAAEAYAVCPGCNVVHHVRLDGLLRMHRYPGFRDVCDGSHRPPHEVSSVPPDSG